MTSHPRRTSLGPSSSVGFHAGELAVQQRAGVLAAAARLSGMLAAPDLRGGVGRFLTDRRLAALSARDPAGRLWISPLVGSPGFLHANGASTLLIHTTAADGDPLHHLVAAQPVGLLAIDFATRRRVRINGALARVSPGELQIDVEQAYGNCPQYIQQRNLQPAAETAASSGAAGIRQARWGGTLTAADVTLIRSADTFLLGTTHPERGNDASHRGGPAGFVRVAARTGPGDGGDPVELWWPDYPGNNMFNSLGNLAVDPTAALWFADFATGQSLHLSGAATLDWSAPSGAGDDGGTGRRVRFAVHTAVAGHLYGLRAPDVLPYPRNPPLTDGPSAGPDQP